MNEVSHSILLTVIIFLLLYLYTESGLRHQGSAQTLAEAAFVGERRLPVEAMTGRSGRWWKEASIVRQQGGECDTWWEEACVMRQWEAPVGEASIGRWEGRGEFWEAEDASQAR